VLADTGDVDRLLPEIAESFEDVLRGDSEPSAGVSYPSG
jgi:hypothetical protein